tara:strand:+ start:1399 stop:2334 length:936 start_codon:yes stop_codon:yes gene_type:complete
MDYYEELGVNRDSDPSTIKKAYRGLCMKWHPDKNNTEEANVKFKRINEAYEVLGDSEQKRIYDLTRNNPFMNMGFSGVPREGVVEINPDDIFSMLFNGLNDSTGIDIPMPGGCAKIFTNMGKMPSRKYNHVLSKPDPIFQTVIIRLEDAYNGCNIPIKIERWIQYSNSSKVTEHETVYLEIPKGVDNDEIFEISKKGNVINKGDLRGDVKVRIEIEEHESYKRNGLDIIYTKKLSLKESLCGFSFELNHLNGMNYNINNNKGNIINPGQEKIIPNLGITREKSCGSLIILFKIEFPKTLSEDTLKKIEELL